MPILDTQASMQISLSNMAFSHLGDSRTHRATLRMDSVAWCVHRHASCCSRHLRGSTSSANARTYSQQKFSNPYSKGRDILPSSLSVLATST